MLQKLLGKCIQNIRYFYVTVKKKKLVKDKLICFIWIQWVQLDQTLLRVAYQHKHQSHGLLIKMLINSEVYDITQGQWGKYRNPLFKKKKNTKSNFLLNLEPGYFVLFV